MSTASWKTIEQTKNFLRLSFVLRLFIHKFIVFHMNLILRVCVCLIVFDTEPIFSFLLQPHSILSTHTYEVFFCALFSLFFLLLDANSLFFLFKSRYRFWLERDSQRNWFLSLNYVNWFPLAYNFLITSASLN